MDSPEESGRSGPAREAEHEAPGHGAQGMTSPGRQNPARGARIIERLIHQERGAELERRLGRMHAADLARVLEHMDQDQWPMVLEHLDISRLSRILEELPDHLRDVLAGHVGPDRLVRAIHYMASDDAADVLADLPNELARDLIQALPEESRQEVQNLLRYPEDTAGGLMQLELVQVPDSATAAEAVEAVRHMADAVGDLHFVYVVDEQQRLCGLLRLPRLLLAAPERPVSQLMESAAHRVTAEVDQEQVARMFARYDLVALPVVDGERRLLGRILLDDVVDVLEEEADEDILGIAGTGPDGPELVYSDRLLRIAAVRLPWLVTTLAGLFVSALMYWKFQTSFPHLLILIPFIPVISAMGGNVGSQSAIIVVRGFATGRVSMQNLGRFLLRELAIAVLMGCACGLVAGTFALLWHGSFLLSVTVAAAMLAAIIAAASMGVLVPYLFRLTGIDPAIAAGPFVTTLEDIMATVIYYLFALALLGG